MRIDQLSPVAANPGAADLLAIVQAGITSKVALGKVFISGLTIGKALGVGIRVDTTTPTYPWHDLLGVLTPGKLAGATVPTSASWIAGRYKAWFYDVLNIADLEYHIPHDYLPGSDLYLHVHWGHHGTAISGSFAISFGATYAKGHNQAAFQPEVALSLSVPTPDIATIPRYRHRVDEIPLSIVGGSANLLNTSLLEPDGVVLIGFEVTAVPVISGGVKNLPAIFYVDIHYQSIGIGTKQRAPDFYV